MNPFERKRERMETEEEVDEDVVGGWSGLTIDSLLMGIQRLAKLPTTTAQHRQRR